MSRSALFAVFQWFCIMAFCQSMAITPGNAQASSDKPSAQQSLFNFNSGQFGQISLYAESRNMDSCYDLNANQKQTSAQADVNQLFHMPCMNPSTLPEIAHIKLPASPLLTGHFPNAKLEPIPTQWPDAKVEQIPTTWPNLKVRQIAGHNLGSVPAK
jgi:hypothetical protein